MANLEVNLSKARQYANYHGLDRAVVVKAKSANKTRFFSDKWGAPRWQADLSPERDGGVFASRRSANDALKCSQKIYGKVDTHISEIEIIPLF